MKNRQKALNITAAVLAVLLLAVVLWGVLRGGDPLHMQVSYGIEQVDLDTIYLQSSGLEVNFSDIILSGQNETRKLIVGTQTGTVTTQLTDRLIRQLDFDFLKKTQNVSYTGTGFRACRYKMIIDQYDLILIPDFLKAHLTKFIHHKRDKDIMYHHPIHFHRLNLSRRYRQLTGIFHHDLLN